MSKKPTLGIDISRLANAQPTGVELATSELLRNLIPKLRKKYQLRLYTPKKIKNLKINSGEYKIIRAKRLWTFWHLARELRNNPPDVFFSPSNFIPCGAPRASYTIIHDIAWRVFPASYSLARRLILSYGLRTARRAQKILVPSEATKRDLIKYEKISASKIEVIPFGFEAPKRKVVKQKKRQILYIGRIESKKNLSNLIRGFNQFQKKHPDYRLILAGGDGYGATQIKKLGRKNPAIKFKGYISKTKKDELLKNSEVFVFPSLYEGFGFPILEAQSYALPVITSSVSSCPEIGGKGAIYINPQQANGIAVALSKVIDQPQLQKTLIRAAEKNLEKFQWRECAQRYLQILK